MSESLDFAGIDGKLPPQNIEAEEAILGGILLDPEAIERVVDNLSPEAFYLQAHGDIYAAALRLHSEHKPTDLLTITCWLSDHDLLERVGGRNKLATLVDRTVSAINIDGLAEMVVEKYLSRKLISTGNQIVKLGYDLSQPLVQRLDAAEQKVFSIRHQSQLDDQPERGGDIVVRVFAEIEEINQGTRVPGIPCGFYDLDTLTSGFQPGDLIVLAARPSMGKSAIVHQIAYTIALSHKAPTLIFSLEMSKEEIMRRLLSSVAQIEGSYFRTGRISSTQWERIALSIAEISEVPIHIDHKSNITTEEIRSKVRKMIAKEGSLKLVAIDYLQLMANGEGQGLVQNIGEITRKLKLLARECNVPIILLCQLNRGVEGRTNRRPILSDLRDSGRIEEDADVVMTLYRDEYYTPDTPDRGIAELAILKHRSGPTGLVKLLFNPQYVTFHNLVRP